MAKVTIVIEDLPGDQVKIVADPSLEDIFKMTMDGHETTSAHGYAFAMLNTARAESKSKEPHKIILPKRPRLIT